MFLDTRSLDAKRATEELVGKASVDEASMSVLWRGVLVKVSFQVGVWLAQGFAGLQGEKLSYVMFHEIGINIPLASEKNSRWGLRRTAPHVKFLGLMEILELNRRESPTSTTTSPDHPGRANARNPEFYRLVRLPVLP